MLVLLLDGLWEGVQSQATIYPDRVGADLYVTQPGVADFLGETSTIPRATVAVVRRTPGVRWADPVRGQFVVFALHGKKVASYVVGYEPGRHGGPWSLSEGRTVRRDDEVVVDAALARRHGLGTGDAIEVGGRRFHVVGLTPASGVMTGFMFVTHAATDSLLRSPATTSYVLVGAIHPRDVKHRLEAQDLTVFTKDRLAANDRQLYTGIFGSTIKLMVAVAFVVGALVVALTIYASVVERRREYGIIKALGGTSSMITATVLRQTLAVTAVGFVIGGGLYLAGRALIAQLRPQFSVVLTTGGLFRALAAALLMGIVASVVPAHRVAAAEPASVYGEH